MKKLRLYKNLDSMCIFIGQQVCFHNTMKHENNVSNLFGCQVVRICSLMKEIQVNTYICTSYIIFFLFVKMENNNFI